MPEYELCWQSCLAAGAGVGRMLMNYGFAFSVEYGPWRSEGARPVVVLTWQGQPKLHDAAAYAQALRPGQILRVAADSHELLAGLEAWCGHHSLRIVTT